MYPVNNAVFCIYKKNLKTISLQSSLGLGLFSTLVNEESPVLEAFLHRQECCLAIPTSPAAALHLLRYPQSFIPVHVVITPPYLSVYKQDLVMPSAVKTEVFYNSKLGLDRTQWPELSSTQHQFPHLVETYADVVQKHRSTCSATDQLQWVGWQLRRRKRDEETTVDELLPDLEKAQWIATQPLDDHLASIYSALWGHHRPRMAYTNSLNHCLNQ